MDYFSWLVYGIFMVIACALAYKTERKNYDPVWLGITYLFVVVFWGIRYDIGHDYQGYRGIFSDIKYGGWSYVEPGFYFLNKLFAWSETGYIGVLAVSTALTYFFLFKTFTRYRVLFFGLLFSLAFQYQFMAANQVRQAIVIAAFLYALRFVEDHKYWRYVLFMTLMASIHFTALFMIAALVMARIRIPSWGWLCLIVGSYGLLLVGAFKTVGGKLMMALPFYQVYQASEFRMSAEETGFSIVMLFWVIIALYLLLYRKTINRPVLFNIYMIGVVSYIVFFEFHLLNRMVQYFTFINILFASILCKNDFRKGLPLLLISFVAFNLLSARAPDKNGIQPYQTIFEQKLERYK